MRSWLPADHPVWFVLEVIEELDTSALRAGRGEGGVGRRGYDPDMLLALFVYAYLRGMTSSRAMESACHTDVAFRVVCAQDVPDHTVLARFRQRYAEPIAGLFDQVLALCARAGLGRVEVVSIDGTKIAANASIDANRGLDRLVELTREPRPSGGREFLDEVAAVDAAEDAAEAAGASGTDELDPPWRDRSNRQGRIKEALRQAREVQRRREEPVREADAKTDAKQRRYDDRVAEREAAQAAYQAKVAAGRRPNGRPISPGLTRKMERDAASVQAARDKAHATRSRVKAMPPAMANTTDPQSRVMKTRQGWIQGYNCQLAVADDGLILATNTCQDTTDTDQFVPMMQAAEKAVEVMNTATGNHDQIATILADAGYLSDANLTHPGPPRLIAAGKKHDLDRSHIPSPKDTAIHTMIEHLKEPENKELYKRRAATVEPRNAHLKDRRGLRRFTRRGLAAARHELATAAWITNLATLYNHQAQAT